MDTRNPSRTPPPTVNGAADRLTLALDGMPTDGTASFRAVSELMNAASSLLHALDIAGLRAHRVDL